MLRGGERGAAYNADVRIKICGITRPRDVDACEEAGVDAIGLVFAAGSRRLVTLPQAAEIVARASPFLTTVGVFRGQSDEQILDYAHRLNLGAVQIHQPGPGQVRRLVDAGLRVIAALPFDRKSELALAREQGAGAVLVDNQSPGSGRPFDWSMVRESVVDGRLILAGGLRPDNVALAVSTTRPWGVDVSTGVESSPGIKDGRLIERFVSAARAARRDAVR